MTTPTPAEAAMLDLWRVRWGLTSDGPPFRSLAGVLAPVRRDGVAAMLKIALGEEERRGADLMVWWDGRGAARVLAHEREALLLERLEGPRSLARMAREGQDAAACRILCETARRLHQPRRRPPPTTLVPLERWFAALWPAAARIGGFYATAAATARDLLAAPEPPVVLHGDLHHDNVLDGGARDWLAIDPKGLFGDRGYDHASMLCNPGADVAADVGVFRRRLAVAVGISGLAPARICRWVTAYAGLSAAWTLGDGGDPWQALAVGRIAASELGL